VEVMVDVSVEVEVCAAEMSMHATGTL